VRWREETRARDRPPGPERPGRRGARRGRQAPPATLERLAQIRGLNESTLRRRGARSSKPSSAGARRDPIPVDGDRPRPATPRTLRSSPSARRWCAPGLEAELAYELIAARADLQRIVTRVRTVGQGAEVRTLQGWRREVVGAELLELLQGRRSLRVGPGRTIEVTG
jgi:ribonuclease D